MKATFTRENGFWVGRIEGVTQTIVYKTEKACRKWTAHYIANHCG